MREVAQATINQTDMVFEDRIRIMSIAKIDRDVGQ